MRISLLLSILLAFALVGCWTDDQEVGYDLAEVRFTNPHLAGSTEALYRVFDVGQDVEAGNLPPTVSNALDTLEGLFGGVAEDYLRCPDGRFPRYLQIRTVNSEPTSPVALWLHPGALDYGLSFEGQETFYAKLREIDGDLSVDNNRPDRLNLEWAESALRTNLGLPVNGNTSDNGAMIASLLESGFIILAPINCWGDQWAGYGQNLALFDQGYETFARIGNLFALYPLLAIAEGTFTQTTIDATNLGSRLAIYAPGDSGRGVAQWFYQDTPPNDSIVYTLQPVIMLDGSPDRLSSLAASTRTDTVMWMDGLARVQGMERVNFDPVADSFSITAGITSNNWAGPIRFVWFDRGNIETDYPWPATTMQPLDAAIGTLIGAPQGVSERAVDDNRYPLSNKSRETADGFVAWALARLGITP